MLNDRDCEFLLGCLLHLYTRVHTYTHLARWDEEKNQPDPSPDVFAEFCNIEDQLREFWTSPNRAAACTMLIRRNEAYLKQLLDLDPSHGDGLEPALDEACAIYRDIRDVAASLKDYYLAHEMRN